jgi:hypothetical protein
MVEATRHIEFPDSRKFTHQYPQSPELYGVARLPYGARHGICTDDASILGGHPAALITVGEAIGHLLSALDGGHLYR